jgi:tetratricopeptide (TPR) repeat protein
LQGQSGFIDARCLLAVLLSKLGRPGEAVEALETVLGLVPDHPDAHKELGNLLYEAGDYKRALPHLEVAARTDPAVYETNARLAMCYEQAGRLPAAQTVYKRLHALAPNSAEVCVNLGRVLAAAGSNGEALDCFTQAIQLDPNYGNAYFNAGDLLYNLEQYDRAADTYIAGLHVTPQQPSGFFVLGNCFFQTRNYESAVISYRQELDQNPDHGEARHNLVLAESLHSEVRAA